MKKLKYMKHFKRAMQDEENKNFVECGGLLYYFIVEFYLCSYCDEVSLKVWSQQIMLSLLQNVFPFPFNSIVPYD